MSEHLSKETIERIVSLDEPCPRSHSNLTLIRQIQFCQRMIAQEKALVDPMKVVEVDEVVMLDGVPKLGKDGFPVSEKRKRYARDLAGEQWRKQLADSQNALRRWLQKDNQAHARDSEDLQRAITERFGDAKARAGLSAQVSAFAREYQREHGHFTP